MKRGSEAGSEVDREERRRESGAVENVKELLNGESGVLNGQTVLVTGTLPKLGRMNLVRLIENYGGEM